MNYSTLTKTQKRCIDAFITIRPELATQDTITRQEIEDLFNILYAEREHGGEKIGYPMWLVKGEKTGRGVYKFPAPNATQSVKTEGDGYAEPVTSAKNAEEDKEFFTELQEYGIMETA